MNSLELRALRAGVRLSQAAMAEAVGVTRQQYMRYEKGYRKRTDKSLAPVRIPGPVAKLARLVKEGYDQYYAELDEAQERLREAQDMVEEMERARQVVAEEEEL